MKNDPKFEVWGNWDDDIEYGADFEHLEDCFTYAEAVAAAADYRSHCRTAFIVDKETGEQIDG